MPRTLVASRNTIESTEQDTSGMQMSALWCITVLFSTLFANAVYRLPLAAYVQDLNDDDSFYYYLIARNFARGLFSTADGTHLTNGYHPVWAVLLTPVFWLVRDSETALRVAKMEELVILLVAGCLFMAAGLKAGWKVPVLLVFPVCLFSNPIYFCGLEVAPQVLALATLMFLLTLLFQDPGSLWKWVAFSVTCALLPWVRLEALTAGIATAALVSLYMLCTRRGSLSRVLGIWAGIIGSLAVYFSYNAKVFGTAVPVSGQVKAYWTTLRFAQTGGRHLLHDAHFYLGQHKTLLAATIACLLLVGFSWSRPLYRTAPYRVNHAVDVFVLALAFYLLSRLIYSICFLYFEYDAPWYYVPGMLLLALLAPLTVSRIFLLYRMDPARTLRHRRTEAWAGIVALVLVIAAARPFQDIRIWNSGWRPNWQAASFEGTQWMNEHLPSSAVIGSSDSGVVAYFSRHSVVNLDGLANSDQFFAAVRNQSVEAWMKRENIHYLANSMWTNMSGCSFMARASAQKKDYSSPCTLIYEGRVSWTDRWAGATRPMRFRVLASCNLLGPCAPEKRP